MVDFNKLSQWIFVRLSKVSQRVAFNIHKFSQWLRSQNKIYLTLCLMVLSGVVIAAFLWHHFGTDAALPVLADSTPIILAVAGIVMSYLPPKREVHLIATVIVLLVGVAGTVVLSVARKKSDKTHQTEIGTLNHKLDSVGDQNTRLANFLISERGNGGLSEADRRKGIEATLRSKYILSHNPIDPQILAGNAMPPSDWMNQELNKLGEHWTVSESPKGQIPRSYITFDGVPRFVGTTSTVEGGDFKPGDLLAFNLHYQVSGPNSVQTISRAMAVYAEPGFGSETQRAMIDKFTEEVQEERKTNSAASMSGTLMPGDKRFDTAHLFVGRGQTPQPLTQEDLNELKIGQKVAFVVFEILYKDLGKLHHTRMCAWLQPPASPPGIWHYCDVFENSD